MSHTSDFIAAERVEFQGRITASVSHELNNVFATISETAGLSADLMAIHGTGRPLDAAELRSCADTIVDEVKRGFRVVKTLNVFSHSSDTPISEVDLTELVSLMAELAGYLSYSCTVDLRRREGPGPRLITRPLLLEDLVYRGFVHAFRAVGPDGSIEVSTDSSLDGGRIVISGLGGVGVEGFLDDDVHKIVQSLNGRIETDASHDELHILLPASMTGDDVE
jgi:signal transduction histidine kinase